MAANTKQLKGDVDKKSSPQYFDPELDEYGYLYGSNGASRHMLYGPDGNPITTTGNKLAVRATEIETQLTDIQGYIDGIEGAIGTAAVSPAANTLLARLKNLETKVDAIIADGIKLSGRTIEVIPLVNALAITDTTRRDVTLPDLKKYKEWDILITDTHKDSSDGEAIFNFGITGGKSSLIGSDKKGYEMFWVKSGGYLNAVYESISGRKRGVSLFEMMPGRGEYYIGYSLQSGVTVNREDVLALKSSIQRGGSSFSYQYKSAPASGSLTVELIGVIN